MFYRDDGNITIIVTQPTHHHDYRVCGHDVNAQICDNGSDDDNDDIDHDEVGCDGIVVMIMELMILVILMKMMFYLLT